MLWLRCLAVGSKFGLLSWISLDLRENNLDSVSTRFLLRFSGGKIPLFICNGRLLKTGMNLGAILRWGLKFVSWTRALPLLGVGTPSTSAAWSDSSFLLLCPDSGWRRGAQDPAGFGRLAEAAPLWPAASEHGGKLGARGGPGEGAGAGAELNLCLAVRLGSLTLFSWKDKH